ncbi:hypothetical protein DPMN_117968 [Dreissena polymorpha]|uniref:Uncharacterized protein n=1 Tax=Dreissena polymorpha TaxID=45954 RepID=A0A9D4GM97_DREPO|nr:hypothetical protein DPMN_117968 [Dreissena polymorpha]
MITVIAARLVIPCTHFTRGIDSVTVAVWDMTGSSPSSPVHTCIARWQSYRCRDSCSCQASLGILGQCTGLP